MTSEFLQQFKIAVDQCLFLAARPAFELAFSGFGLQG